MTKYENFNTKKEQNKIFKIALRLIWIKKLRDKCFIKNKQMKG